MSHVHPSVGWPSSSLGNEYVLCEAPPQFPTGLHSVVKGGAWVGRSRSAGPAPSEGLSLVFLPG